MACRRGKRHKQTWSGSDEADQASAAPARHRLERGQTRGHPPMGGEAATVEVVVSRGGDGAWRRLGWDGEGAREWVERRHC